MTPGDPLQEAVAKVLEAANLPIKRPIIRRLEKDFENDLTTGEALQSGFAMMVMTPVPTSALQGQRILFFDKYDVRIRMAELVSINDGPNVFELIIPVAKALHWTNPGGLLAHPLMIAQRPVDVAEGKYAAPGFEHDGKFIRVLDVVFRAVLQITS